MSPKKSPVENERQPAVVRDPEGESRWIDTVCRFTHLLLNVREEQEIYSILSETITRIVPGVFVIISKLQPGDMNFRIVASSGFDAFFNAIKKLIGKDPFTLDFPFQNLTDKQLESFENRIIHHFPGGIHDLVNGVIHPRICRTIEKMLGIGNVYGMSFCVDKKYYGGFSLFVPASAIKSGSFTGEAERIIELVANQVSSVIQRIRETQLARESEEQLRETTFQLETLVENTNSGYIFEGSSRTILKVNLAFCNMFGIQDPGQLVGMDCREASKLAAPIFKDPEGFIRDIESAVSENQAIYNQELLMADSRILERDFIPVMNGRFSGYIWQYRDITKRKHVEEELRVSQERFSQLVNQLNDVIWKANGDGSGMIDLNNSFKKIYGYTSEDFRKNPNLWLETVHPDDKKIAESSGEELSRTGKASAEYRILRPNGKVIWLQDRKSIIYDDSGKPVQMGGVATDITEQKKATTEIERQKEDLERLNSTKDKLFSVISHDLKSPFNSILGFSDILLEETDLDDKTRKYITIIHTNAKKTLHLIDNLLDWARSQTGQIQVHRETLRISDVIREVKEILSVNAEIKNISLRHLQPDDSVIYSDLNLVKAILRNLINNAIKFTGPGGTVDIYSISNENEIEIIVSDTGIGMSEEVKSTLFSLEKTVSAPGTEKEKGTGLGLVLCQEFVRILGGSIRVESEPGKGSTFAITIPLSAKTDPDQ